MNTPAILQPWLQEHTEHSMPFRKLALMTTIGLAIAAFFAFDLGQYLNLQTLKDQHAAIQAFQANNPLSSVAISASDGGRR